jgi:ABC-type amino acid transport substrate-binding protein
MKQLFLCLLPLLFSSSVFAQTLRVGYFEVAPYIFTEKGSTTPKGASVEFLEKLIAPAMGVKIVWAKEAVGIPRLQEQLKANQLDAAAVFAKNPERVQFLTYPEKPFLTTNPVLAVLRDNPLQKVQKIEDVILLKIGHCAKAFTSPFMRDQRVQWELMSSSNCVPLNLQKLIKKRFDAQYQPDAPPLLYYAREEKVENDIRLVSLPEVVEIYTPFSKGVSAQVVEKYQKAFDQVGGQKAYLKMLGTYIDVTKL